MTAKRMLLAAVCATAFGSAAVAQVPLFGGRTSTAAPLSTRPTVPPPTASGSAGSATALFPTQAQVDPLVQPPAVIPTQGVPVYAPATAATDVLTAPQGGIPGAAYSPWVGATPAGYGGHGPVTYEGYLRTGPSLNIGGGELSANLEHGWMTAVGGRTLFFNPTQDAAWVLDLGFSFTQNYGRRLERLTDITIGSLRGRGESETDTLSVGVRTIRRTSFNFGIGRDWWMYGPGTVADVPGASNWRGGFDIGGRWGTSSIDLEPRDEPEGVRRRQAVYHGVYIGSTLNWERQFGPVILQAGIRAEWGYDWTNLLPPQTSDLQNLNCLMMFGMRY